jgi:hypothetical protein
MRARTGGQEELRRQVAKITLLATMSLVAIVMIAAGAFMWRLSRGPVALDFLASHVEERINANLAGMQVRLADLVVERDAQSGMPRFRLRNVELRGGDGGLIARAPRAAIAVEGGSLLVGNFVPRDFELIGPSILVRRQLDGQFKLGYGPPPADETEEVAAGEEQPGKADQAPDVVSETTGEELLKVLSGTPEEGAEGFGNLKDIRVSGARIALYDEANGAQWLAPKADLVFKRMPYGFAVVANADIAGRDTPFRTEIAANYRRANRSFAISARIFDLIPAELSKKIFALSQLAQVRLPLSGHAEIEMTDAGRITQASAEFSAAAGDVGFPDYIAEPIIVDEGSLRVDYDPSNGGLKIADSSILVGGSRAEIAGRIDPLREADGKLKALAIKLNARNVRLDTTGTVKDPTAIDRIDFDGIASVEEARLDVNDLIIMAGAAGVRLKGSLTGGDESPGIKMGGRMRDLPHDVLKKLWPPVVAPNTRKWVSNNVKAGRIADSEFTIDLKPNDLARGKRDKRLPEGSINMKLVLADVTTSYFKDLPNIVGADATALLTADYFEINWSNGTLNLPSGATAAIPKGSMVATALLNPLTPAEFRIAAAGNARAILEYVDLPALGLLKKSNLDINRLGGEADVDVTLAFPLMKDLPRDMVKVKAAAKIANASLKNVLGGIDLTGGTIDLTVGEGLIAATGPIKIDGIPAKVSWTRSTGPDAKQDATIETELDEKERAKIGVHVNDFVRGPVGVKVTIDNFDDAVAKARVVADLSKAELRLAAIDWTYAPRPKTTATFDYVKTAKGVTISDLTIKGQELSIAGDIKVDADGGIAEARLPTVILNDENRFGLVARPVEGGLSISIDGRSFDARPLIKSVFSPSSSGKPSGGKSASKTFMVEANVDRVYAFRGEVITGVRGSVVTRGDAVRQARLQGVFISGNQIALRMAPNGDGNRELSVSGSDGGAALRAANLYSKIAGGELTLVAVFSAPGTPSGSRGQLTLRNFEVRNEAALAQLDKKGKPLKSGPRKGGLRFSKLSLPFRTDAKFVRLGDTLIKGADLGATAEGVIRKADGAIDITGTIIPAYALNSFVGNIPLLGDLLTGGKGEGLFGMTYALGGSLSKPRFQVNPASMILPGPFRKLAEFN